MKESDFICFIGGDERQKYAAEAIAEHIKINTVGDVFKTVKHHRASHFENPIKAMYGAKAIVLPLPAAASEGIISFSDLSESIIKSSAYLLGGKFSPYLSGIIEQKGIRHDDYYKDEVFTVKNAYITAEGAIQLAMSSIKGSLRASKCAILGYGRIGRALSELLKPFNAEVSVFARRDEALVWAEESGFSTIKITSGICSMNGIIDEFDVIFNTVPERIISNEALLSIPSDTVLIELASPPGGFDPDIAEQCDLHYIDGKGIPGKYAPRSAGKIVSDTVIRYLKKEGIL